VIAGGLVIRGGDVQADRPLALEMFRRHLNPRYDAARFDWMYRRNPHGPGRLWVAADTGDGSVAGVAGAFPRRMYVGGREEIAWVLGDFCVSDRHRSIGPALSLQRACLAAVSAEAIPFCYDFPSPRMMAVYRRMGIGPFGQMVRLRRLLRVEGRVDRFLRVPGVLRGAVGALGNRLLARRILRGQTTPGLMVALHDGLCGDEFSAVASRCAAQHGVSVQRSAEYLNWRYLENPFCRHEIMTARRAGVLEGYAIFNEQDSGAATVVDMLAADAPTVVALVRGVVALTWRRGLETVTVTLLASHPWVRLLERAGFRARETSPVVVYVSPAVTPSEMSEGLAWHLLCGDRDS
jgi:hypothetical protein